MVYCSFYTSRYYQFILGFERNKIRKQKIKFYYSPQVSKKFQHKVDYLISLRQPHKLSTEKNMKQTCKEKYLHIKNQNMINIPRKTLHIEFYVQNYGRTKIILLQKIFSCTVQKRTKPKVPPRKKLETMEQSFNLIPKKLVLHIHNVNQQKKSISIEEI